ncbi:MAG: hypothetical protein PHU24_05090, partial [Sphaerochaetaceae bacterium]|nr:hypothetical protein [Sphaerochaetaceae bacterium]MDD4260016.1 hypothetical protein [Sphaerochaetaceae bacterium]MDD4841158.1 hypothetical protein [Sphaerochaetaceae bacterium]MDX9934977.1 hypothetical protein [Sphaerochaetaceae bacterium]
FRYCFFPPTPRGVRLASRYRVRRQLRPLGISPKNDDMPVILKAPDGKIRGGTLEIAVAHNHIFLTLDQEFYDATI